MSVHWQNRAAIVQELDRLRGESEFSFFISEWNVCEGAVGERCNGLESKIDESDLIEFSTEATDRD